MFLEEELLLSQTILIVDDKPNNLQLLSKYLNEANYDVLSVQNGEKAISIAKKLQPNLILLDVMMPNMDGFDVCYYLKQDAITKDIPIIFMTALTETQNKVKGLRLGAVDYISKPFEEEELLARIKTHLSLSYLYQLSLKETARRNLLFEISDRIRQSLDLRVILETASKEIRKFLDCDFVGIASLDQQQVVIEAYSSARDEFEIDPQKFVSYDELCPSEYIYQSYLKGQVEVREKPSIKEDSEEISVYAPLIKLIVPIVIVDYNYTSGFFSSADEDTTSTNNFLYGWVILDHYSHCRFWHSENINLLTEVTTQLAIGIKQGLLHQQLSQRVTGI